MIQSRKATAHFAAESGMDTFRIEIRLKHGYQPDPRTHVAGWRLRKETKSIPKQPHYFMLSRALKQYNFSSFLFP
jgi:hypothetical protein